MEIEVKIDTEMITLGQLLKLTDLISSGGMAKWFLSEHEVLINGVSKTNGEGVNLRFMIK